MCPLLKPQGATDSIDAGSGTSRHGMASESVSRLRRNDGLQSALLGAKGARYVASRPFGRETSKDRRRPVADAERRPTGRNA
jgi:hypothetical protein